MPPISPMFVVGRQPAEAAGLAPLCPNFCRIRSELLGDVAVGHHHALGIGGRARR